MHAQIHPPPPPPHTHTHSHIDSGSRANPVGLTIPLCSTLRLVPSVLDTSTCFSCESTQCRFWLSQSIASDVTAMGCSLRMRWGVRSEGEGEGREGEKGTHNTSPPAGKIHPPPHTHTHTLSHRLWIQRQPSRVDHSTVQHPPIGAVRPGHFNPFLLRVHPVQVLAVPVYSQ